MTARTRRGIAKFMWPSVAVAVVCVTMMEAPEAQSQSSPDRKRVMAAVAIGAARPSDPSFRELYGPVQYPVSVQADFEVRKHVSIFAGYGYLRRAGTTLAADPALLPGDPIKFSMHSIKAGLSYAVPFGRVTLLGSGGAGFHRYHENWEAAGIATTGNKTGFIAQGQVEYALTRVVSMVGRVEYMRAVIRAKSVMENDASLGRLEVSLGVSLCLNQLVWR